MSRSESYNRTAKAMRLADAWHAYVATTNGHKANPADVYRWADTVRGGTSWRAVAVLAGYHEVVSDESRDATLAVLAHQAPHRTMVRSATSGEATNFIIECTCTRHIAVAGDHAAAYDVATGHEVLNDPTDPRFTTEAMMAGES